jgi:hypothetical protein
MTLPDLPRAERIEAAQFCDDAYWFSAEQMREYGHLVRASALEEAAQECENQKVGFPSYFEIDERIAGCANAIRALAKEKT